MKVYSVNKQTCNLILKRLWKTCRLRIKSLNNMNPIHRMAWMKFPFRKSRKRINRNHNHKHNSLPVPQRNLILTHLRALSLPMNPNRIKKKDAQHPTHWTKVKSGRYFLWVVALKIIGAIVFYKDLLRHSTLTHHRKNMFLKRWQALIQW